MPNERQVGGHHGVAVAVVGAVILLALRGSPPRALADVSTPKTYDVGGSTLAEVWKDIEAKGFRDGDKLHAGQAESTVGSPDVPIAPKCERIPMQGCPQNMGWSCTAAMTPTWGVDTVITLPNWPGAASACDKVKAEWNRFVDALKKHEEGHDAVAKMALADAKPASPITSDAKTDCDMAKALAAAEADLAAKYAAELARLKAAVDAANAKYDADSGHGATQGATLDTSIVCDEVDNSPAGKLKALLDDLDFLTDKALGQSLKKKLTNALESIEKGKTEAAKGQLDAFIKEVKAQSGKKIGKDAAADLVKRAEEVKQALK